MSSNMKKLNNYLKFLALTYDLNGSRYDINVDPIALELLKLIFIHSAVNAPLSISNAMQKHTLGSPATLHRKIRKLHQANLIELTHMGNNKRTKYIILSKKAENYFIKVSSIMDKVLT